MRLRSNMPKNMPNVDSKQLFFLAKLFITNTSSVSPRPQILQISIGLDGFEDCSLQFFDFRGGGEKKSDDLLVNFTRTDIVNELCKQCCIVYYM